MSRLRASRTHTERRNAAKDAVNACGGRRLRSGCALRPEVQQREVRTLSAFTAAPFAVTASCSFSATHAHAQWCGREVSTGAAARAQCDERTDCRLRVSRGAARVPHLCSTPYRNRPTARCRCSRTHEPLAALLSLALRGAHTLRGASNVCSTLSSRLTLCCIGVVVCCTDLHGPSMPLDLNLPAGDDVEGLRARLGTLLSFGARARTAPVPTSRRRRGSSAQLPPAFSSRRVGRTDARAPQCDALDRRGAAGGAGGASGRGGTGHGRLASGRPDGQRRPSDGDHAAPV